MGQFNEAAQFVFGEQHDGKRLAEIFGRGTKFINRQGAEAKFWTFSVIRRQMQTSKILSIIFMES
jgi:hypothetical protein